MTSPAVPASGRVWAGRCVRSNFVVALGCLLIFFFLLRYQLSLGMREVCTAAVLVCWQACFAACYVGRRRFPRLWPAARTTAVVLFVGGQLFFLVVRNTLDFWYTPIKDWCVTQGIWDRGAGFAIDPLNDATDRYANFNGIDQNWRMFTPPLSRSAQFLAARVEFTDGTSDVILSEEEPDPHGFFRFGGWRQRKFEYALAYARGADRPLLEPYARWSLRRWQDGRPDDPRTPTQVVLVRREIALPTPGQDPSAFPEAEDTPVGTFRPDGSPEP